MTKVVNAEANPLKSITSDGTLRLEYSPVTDGNWVIYARTNYTLALPTREIVAYNIRTDETFVIDTFNSSVDPNLRISNNTVIWSFWDNSQYEVKLYDLNKKELKSITFPDQIFELDLYQNKLVGIVFKNGQRDLFLYDLITKETTPLTEDTTQDSSPSIYGNKIAFMRYVDGHRNVFLYDLSKNSLKKISSLTSDAFEPQIYKDKIIWHTATDVYIYDITKDSLKTIENIGSLPFSWYAIETARVYDENIVFTVHGAIESQFYIRTYLYDIRNSTYRQITANLGWEGNPDIANQYIVFTAALVGNDNPDLYLYKY